jgi:hypothetical protein
VQNRRDVSAGDLTCCVVFTVLSEGVLREDIIEEVAHGQRLRLTM